MRVLALLLVLSTAVPALAWAQTRPRGDRALFGGGVGNAEQVLSIGSNAGISFYETLTRQPPTTEGEPAQTSTRLARGSASLTYSLDVPYAEVGASLTGFSYYQPPPLKQLLNDYSFGANASTGRTWRISPRSQLSASQAVNFQPAYQELLPNGSDFGTADPSQIFSPDVTAFDGEILTSSTHAGFNYDFSRRVALYSSYSLERYWTFGNEDSFDRIGHTGTSGLRVLLTRHLSVRGGYRFNATNQPGEPYVRSQGADVGIDYSRGGGLRLTRHTTMSFGGGLGSSVDTSGSQRYFFLGNIDLVHEIGRTWSASAGYSRNIDFSSLFLDPMLSDNVFADFGGLISSRLSFQSAVGYTTSAVGFAGGENRYDTAHALVGLQSGLTRYIALGVNYTYYFRSIGQALELPSGITSHAESQAVHVFVSAWAPLYQRMRRPNGTR